MFNNNESNNASINQNSYNKDLINSNDASKFHSDLRNNKSHKKKEKFSTKWKESQGFKPILSYFYFLFIFLINKKGTWIMPIIIFLLPLLFSIIAITSSEGSTNTIYITSLSIICVLTISFITSKTINLFKDSETEGVEILIVSKPIERWQIIFGKFSILILVSLLISLLNFISNIIGVSIVNAFKKPNTSEMIIFNQVDLNVNYALLVFGASIALCLLFGSITSLITIKCSKKLSSSIPIMLFMLMYMGTFFSGIISTIGENGSSAYNFYNKWSQTSSIQYNQSFKYTHVNNSVWIGFEKSSIENSSTDSNKVSYQTLLDEITVLKNAWNATVNTGNWYTALKWADLAVPLFETTQILNNLSLIDLSKGDLSFIRDPNYTYSSKFYLDSQVNSNNTNVENSDVAKSDSNYQAWLQLTNSSQLALMSISKGINKSPNWAVVFLWCLISVSFLSFSTYLYMRRDFR